MTGIYEFEGWAPRIIRAYHEPPINAFRVLALGLDGSNAVAIKVESDGTVVTSGGGSGSGNVTANAGLGTFNIAGTITGFLPTINGLVTVTGFLPSITGIVTVGGLPPTSEAVYAHGALESGSINGSGGAFVLLATHSAVLRSMTIYNTTDQTLQISFDGTVSHALLPEGSTESWNWREDDLHESSNVFARSNNASAPTSGRAIANGMTA